MGLFDPEVAQQFAMDPEERKRLLLGNWLMGISSGLLGSRKGDELRGLGFGSLAGVNAGQQAIGAASQDKYNQFRMMAEGQKVVDQRKAQEQAARDQQELQGIFTGGGAPDLTPLANGQGPTVANAAAQAPGSSKGDAYRKAAEWYAARGRTEDAKRAMDMANSFDEEFSQTPHVVMRDGKAVNALIGKKGTVRTMDGFDPTPKFREVNRGGSIDLVNDYNIPSVGQSFSVTMNPYQKDESARGWAHLKLAQDKANQEKAEQYGTPIQITTPDGGTQLMIPKKGTSQVVPMTDAQGQPVTKSASIPQKYKDTLYNLNNLEAQIKSYNDELSKFSTGTYFSPEAATKLTSKYSSLKMDLKNLYELGALAGPDVAILAEGLTDPSSLKGFVMPRSHFETQTKVIEDRLNAARGNLAKAYNQPETKAEPKQDAHPVLKSEAEYNSLPSGATYVGPDGKLRRKR